MAPFCLIQCRAAEVSSPPEKAMPTFWPTGRDSRITDMLGKPFVGVRDQRSGVTPECRLTIANISDDSRPVFAPFSLQTALEALHMSFASFAASYLPTRRWFPND